MEILSRVFSSYQILIDWACIAGAILDTFNTKQETKSLALIEFVFHLNSDVE